MCLNSTVPYSLTYSISLIGGCLGCLVKFFRVHGQQAHLLYRLTMFYLLNNTHFILSPDYTLELCHKNFSFASQSQAGKWIPVYESVVVLLNVENTVFHIYGCICMKQPTFSLTQSAKSTKIPRL